MARFLTQNKVLFQHIPNTDGAWIEEAIQCMGIGSSKWLNKQPNNLPRKHSLLPHYYQQWAQQVDYVFAFVRHPVTYYESTWKWMRNTSGTGLGRIMAYDWHPHQVAIKWMNFDFNTWVDKMLEHEMCWVTRMYENYVGPTGGEYCHFIGRQETLEIDFFAAMQLFGYDKISELSREKINQLDIKNVPDSNIKWNIKLQTEVKWQERAVIERFYTGDNKDKRIYREVVKKENSPVVGG